MASFGKTNMPAQFDVANEMPYKPQALLFFYSKLSANFRYQFIPIFLMLSIFH